MVLHDASLAAPLRLIWAGLDLHRPPFAPPPYSVESAASASVPQTACFTTSRGDGGCRKCLPVLGRRAPYPGLMRAAGSLPVLSSDHPLPEL